VQPADPKEAFPLTAPWAWIGAALAGVFLVLLHAFWSNGAAKANSIDKDISLHFFKAMQNMLDLPFEEKLKGEIDNLSHTRGWTQWSHLVQVSITALLAAAAVLIIWVRSS
jgi:hypothetical protein